MRFSVKHVIKTSRPRFWIYLFGPFLLGVSAMGSLPENILSVITVGIQFLFPANLLIYGVNDIFDYETDKRNPKKEDYEELIKPESHRSLWTWIVLANAPLLVIGFATPSIHFSLLAFLFFSIFYSAPPIRAKTKPILDSAFNVLYVFPGLIGYQLVGGSELSWNLVLAASLWTMAMHAYSAVPDIEPDRETHIETVATFLGRPKTLIFCLGLYLASALFAFPALGWVAVTLGVIYMAMMLISLLSNKNIFKFYKAFPYINTGAGALLFISILL